MMIRGVHTMFYSSKAEELRAFLRDKLQFPATDVGGGWLIFEPPPADMGACIRPMIQRAGRPERTRFLFSVTTSKPPSRS